MISRLLTTVVRVTYVTKRVVDVYSLAMNCITASTPSYIYLGISKYVYKREGC